MTRFVMAGLLLVVALIHLIPLIGVVSAARISALYGITVAEPNLEILLRHRAVLFGLLGGVIAVAAFVRTWQPAAIAMALISVLSFLLLAVSVGGYNDALHRVVVADVFALGALLAATVVWRVRPALAS